MSLIILCMIEEGKKSFFWIKTKMEKKSLLLLFYEWKMSLYIASEVFFFKLHKKQKFFLQKKKEVFSNENH